MPGSSICMHRGIPALSASRDRSNKVAATSDTTSSYFVMLCMVLGFPLMCIKTIGTRNLATVANISGSYVPPETSLTMSAPASIAAFATAAFRVSIEMGISDICARTFSITGTVLCSSSCIATSLAPGRVDSPPISMMSAPSFTISNAWFAAMSADPLRSPPSLKLSGVTFKIPITTVSLKLNILPLGRGMTRTASNPGLLSLS
mmetsp:Transcript_21716/g.47343  ORF Transcript_21716/g.47343 Transcript_21716/m.47343 type:complete len:204 (-) Transcript_21716:981-1592(-)